MAEATGTPRADEELQKFRWRVGRIAGSSFHYHYARLIDTLHAIEKIEQILRSPDILSTHVTATAGINRNEGIGVSEAPRGTLMHHYKVDDDGLVEWANLVIATGHNNMAMNRSVAQVARHHVKGDKIEEPMLNRVEAVIRCYDPCLCCSTHALGDMLLDIELLSPGRGGPRPRQALADHRDVSPDTKGAASGEGSGALSRFGAHHRLRQHAAPR